MFNRTMALWCITLIAISISGCAPKEKPEDKAVGKSLSYLHTQGHDIVDEDGNKVFLESVGLGNWFLPEGYMWKFGGKGDRPRKIEQIVSELIGEEAANEFWIEFRNNYITEQDIIRIKELGFNAVRPALNARLFLTESENPEFVDEGFNLLDNLVKWCKKHKLYVIIDMHGAPGGQTGENIDDSPANEPELFMDVKHQDALVKLWVKIAQTYKDEPTVAAYDLLNEPLPANDGSAKKYGHLVEPLYKRLTTEIRKVDSVHMITLEGINWSNDWSIFGEPFDDNTFYQFHYYCWDNPDNLKDISYYLKMRDTLNVPIWVGETGEKANTIYWGTTQYFEKNNVGWSFWPWKKMDTKNTPYSIIKPENWDLIAAYTRDGEKPSKEIAKKAFNRLLENIKLENCVYYEDVVNSIFRQVPGKIEAENYMQGAYKETWFINDTSQQAENYRVNEFVPIELFAIDSISHSRKWYTEQGIKLKRGEWVTYIVNAKTAGDYKLKVSLHADAIPSKAVMEFNKKGLIIEPEQVMWNEITREKVALIEGENEIKFRVVSGNFKVDYFSFE